MFWRSSSGTVNSEVGREAASRRWRTSRKIMTLIGLIVLAFVALAVWNEVHFQMQVRGVQGFVEYLKQVEDEDYRSAMADTYGGKTPQETLGLYLDAVEKEDYELASRYFIEKEQARELENLKSSSKSSEIFYKYINFVRESKPWNSSLDNPEERNFSMKAETEWGAPIHIQFFRYPNGIWKISSL